MVHVTDLLGGPGCWFLAEPILYYTNCFLPWVLQRLEHWRNEVCVLLSSETESKAVRTAACVQEELLKYTGVLYDQDCHTVDKYVRIRRGSRNAMKGSCKLYSCLTPCDTWCLFVSRQCSVLGRSCPTPSPTKTFSHIQARLYVNPVCVHCQCFGNGRAPVCRLSGCLGEELAVDCFHPLDVYLSGWGGAEPCKRSWRSLAVQRVGPVLPHGVIPVGVDPCAGAVMSGLLLQEQALYKCLQAANCWNQFKWWHLSSHVYQ